jgi:muramoyltetrapeptide carboxypeptidase LdcA involved in peptidoglycan recycling
MHPLTEESLRFALFDSGERDLVNSVEWTDEEVSWASPDWGTVGPPVYPSPVWTWAGSERPASGPGWGGNLEIIDFNLRAGRYLADVESYHGAVLLLETSEETPPATYVYRVLMGMGERGMLQQFSAVLVARAKAWSIENPRSWAERDVYRSEQQEAVQRALADYDVEVPVVFDVDFGHTDPQLVVPIGGTIHVDPLQRRVRATY